MALDNDPLNNLPPDGLPPQPPQDGQATGTPAKSDAGMFENIKRIGNAALEKTVRIVKRGRGRPKKSGQPKENDVVQEDFPPDYVADEMGGPEDIGNPAVAAPTGLAALFKPGLIRRCVAGLVAGLVAFPNAWIEELARKKGYSQDEVDRKIEKAQPNEQEIDALAEFSEIMLREVEVNPEFKKWIPAIAVSSVIAGSAARYGAVVASLKRKPDINT